MASNTHDELFEMAVRSAHAADLRAALEAARERGEGEEVGSYRGEDHFTAGLIVYGKCPTAAGPDWYYGPEYAGRAWFAHPHRLPKPHNRSGGRVDTRFELQLKTQLLRYPQSGKDQQKLRDIWLVTSVSSQASDFVSQSAARPTHSDSSKRLKEAFRVEDVDDMVEYQTAIAHDAYETNKDYTTAVVRLESIAPEVTAPRTMPDQPKTQRYLRALDAAKALHGLREAWANDGRTIAAPTDLLAVAQTLLEWMPAVGDKASRGTLQRVHRLLVEARLLDADTASAERTAMTGEAVVGLVSTLLCKVLTDEKRKSFTNPYYCVGMCAAPELVGRPRTPEIAGLSPPQVVVQDVLNGEKAQSLVEDAIGRGIADQAAEQLVRMAVVKALAGPRASSAEYRNGYQDKRTVIDLATDIFRAASDAYIKREREGGNHVLAAVVEVPEDDEE